MVALVVTRDGVASEVMVDEAGEQVSDVAIGSDESSGAPILESRHATCCQRIRLLIHLMLSAA